MTPQNASLSSSLPTQDRTTTTTTANWPADYCVAPVTQGGDGGGAFSSYRAPASVTLSDGTTCDVAYMVSKIVCWTNDDRMVGIQVYYSNAITGYSDSDPSDLFGVIGWTESSFQFNPGELITALSIYKCEYDSNDFCGGLTFTTSMGRSFSALSGGNKDPVAMDVGYGAVVGIFGDCGDAIDRLGFWQILPALNVDVSEVAYSAAPGTPPVLVPELDQTYENDTSETQSETFTKQYEVSTAQTWSTSSFTEATQSFTVSVSAEAYGIGVSAEGTASWTESEEDVQSLTYTSTETDTFETAFDVPPGQTLNLLIYFYQGDYTLAYTGLATVQLNNDNVFSYFLGGEVTGASTTEWYSTLTQVS